MNLFSGGGKKADTKDLVTKVESATKRRGGPGLKVRSHSMLTTGRAASASERKTMGN